MARVATALLAVIFGCAGLGATAACGAPQYTYVKNTTHRTYFKVPASWRVIDEKALKQMSGATPAPESGGGWAVAYDAAQDPSPAHLVGSNTTEPIVRAASSASGTSFSGFSLVSDAELTAPPGFRGVHEVFQYQVQGGPPQTFDQTVYVNKDASKVYALLLRCSNECYRARRAEVETVTASFTVKEG
jgi:hypothetical protein